jgi:hypothetical protein
VTLAMTVMVRDEADVIEAMIEHHLRQGVDVLIVTDNGSTDGTTEILEALAAEGRIHLSHEPTHDKRQAQAVTDMARRAATDFGADWVINADADEFWVPVDRSTTLGAVFAEMPTAIRSFTVPVIDMIGAPAEDGSGLGRLVYRDTRPVEVLNAVGLLAHSTHDSAHVGDPDVTVSQGNHYVSIASAGSPPEGLGVEVLHLPWRSWRQYERKVRNAGLAYERSGLTPSPNHHGMRDYRRLQDGVLLSFYVARHPSGEELERGIADGWYTEDRVLAEAGLPATTDSPIDATIEPIARATGAALGRADAREAALRREAEAAEAARAAAEAGAEDLRRQLDAERGRAGDLAVQLAATRHRRVVRAADWASEKARRVTRR